MNGIWTSKKTVEAKKNVVTFLSQSASLTMISWQKNQKKMYNKNWKKKKTLLVISQKKKIIVANLIFFLFFWCNI